MKVELPAPYIFGQISNEVFDRLDAVADKYLPYLSIELYTNEAEKMAGGVDVHNAKEISFRGENTVIFSAMREALAPALAINGVAEWLRLGESGRMLGVTYRRTVMQPNTCQIRDDRWHRDAIGKGRTMLGITAATHAMTRFISGEVEGGIHGELGDINGVNKAVARALNKGQAEVLPPIEAHTLVGMTANHMHAAGRNESDSPVLRRFLLAYSTYKPSLLERLYRLVDPGEG